MSDHDTGAARPRLSGLYRYPVKGLSPEPLERATLFPGAALPFDRAYAIENGPGPFDPSAPSHLPKIHFVMLMRNEQLAALKTQFDDATHTLTIRTGGAAAAQGLNHRLLSPTDPRGHTVTTRANRNTASGSGSGHAASSYAAAHPDTRGHIMAAPGSRATAGSGSIATGGNTMAERDSGTTLDTPIAAEGDLGTASGRAAIEAFIAAYMGPALRGAPRVVTAPGHSFSDVPPKCLHIINLESVRTLETLIGAKLNPLRFRPNLIVDGLPAWSEFDLIGKTLRVGAATLEIFQRTERCAATNVDPETGARDLKIPSFLSRTLGHADFGVYAKVVGGGEVQVGDGVVACKAAA